MPCANAKSPSATAAGLGVFSAPAQLVTGLTAVDVGAPPLPGSTTMNGPGSFTVSGSGEYKNGPSDNYQYAYTNVTGTNFTLTLGTTNSTRFYRLKK